MRRARPQPNRYRQDTDVEVILRWLYLQYLMQSGRKEPKIIRDMRAVQAEVIRRNELLQNHGPDCVCADCFSEFPEVHPGQQALGW